MDDETKEINIRFMMPEHHHNKVLKVTRLLSFKENRKVGVLETYKRLVQVGADTILKNNRL